MLLTQSLDPARSSTLQSLTQSLGGSKKLVKSSKGAASAASLRISGKQNQLFTT